MSINEQMTMEDFIDAPLPVIDNIDDITEDAMRELENGREETEVNE